MFLIVILSGLLLLLLLLLVVTFKLPHGTLALDTRGFHGFRVAIIKSGCRQTSVLGAPGSDVD